MLWSQSTTQDLTSSRTCGRSVSRRGKYECCQSCCVYLDSDTFFVQVLMLGRKPYGKVKGGQVVTLLAEGVRLPQPENCPPDLWDILMLCWEYEPTDRPTFAKIVTMLTGKATGGFSRGKSVRTKKTIVQDQKLYQQVPIAVALSLTVNAHVESMFRLTSKRLRFCARRSVKLSPTPSLLHRLRGHRGSFESIQSHLSSN